MTDKLKVISLTIRKGDPGVIAEAKHLLEMAESGELRSLVYSATVVDENGVEGCAGNAVGFSDHIAQLGAIALMQYETAASIMNGA